MTALEFLRAEAVADERFAPIARSPMERVARAAGARFEVRDGWNVAVGYDGAGGRPELAWADVSYLGKLEVQGAPGVELSLGTARRDGDLCWLPIRAQRTLLIGPVSAVRAVRADADPATTVDVTTTFAALAIMGAQARELIARFCALDLRDRVTPVGAVRPGSIARTPGILVREAEQRFLLLVGWALGEHLWTVVADAAQPMGGRPVSGDA